MVLVPDTAQLRFVWVGVAGSNLAECDAGFSFYVRNTVPGVWSGADLQRLADYGLAWWANGKNAGAPAKTTVSSQWRLVRCSAQDLSVVGGVPRNAFPLPAQENGSRAGDPAPPSVTSLVQFRTDGDPPKGWAHWPGGVEADLVGDDWAGAFVLELTARVNDWAADLADPLEGGVVSWAHVRVSRYNGTAVDPTPPRIAVPRAAGITALVQEVDVRDLIGSQRDRRGES